MTAEPPQTNSLRDLSGSLVLSRRLPLILALFLIGVWLVFYKSQPWTFTMVVASSLLLFILSWVNWPRASSLKDLATRTTNALGPGMLLRPRIVSALLAFPLLVLFLLLLAVTVKGGDWRAISLLVSLGSLLAGFCAFATSGRLNAKVLQDAQIPLLLFNQRLAIAVLAMSYAVIMLLFYFTVLVLL